MEKLKEEDWEEMGEGWMMEKLMEEDWEEVGEG